MNLYTKLLYLTLSICFSVGVMAGDDMSKNSAESDNHTAEDGQHQAHYDDASTDDKHTAKHEDAHEQAHIHDHDGDMTAANNHADKYQTSDGVSSHANAHTHHHDDDGSEADSHAHHYYEH